MSQHPKLTRSETRSAVLGRIVTNMFKALERAEPQVHTAAAAIVVAHVILSQHQDPKTRMWNYRQMLKGIKGAIEQSQHIEYAAANPPSLMIKPPKVSMFDFEGLSDEELKPSSLILPEVVPLRKPH